jgi:hypothetical protein
MTEPEIRACYERNDERGRLASGARRVEFLRVRLLETEPSLLGASQNLVAIARTPA